ncbi:MAG TPA: hypothetical protein VHJ34_09220 [Actinomycetota bacterium]|nr:hypothetical protein [Actinomycetota bacterium]
MDYYVNTQAQANGDHEVHTAECSYLPHRANRVLLGDFANCSAAISEARKYYTSVNGCYYCANACHTS